MIKHVTLAAVAIASVLFASCTAQAQSASGKTGYAYLEDAYIDALDAHASNGTDNSLAAADFGYFALFFANAAIAFDEPQWYYWASYYAMVALEFAVEDYFETGNAFSLDACYNLYAGAGYSYDAFIGQ